MTRAIALTTALAFMAGCSDSTGNDTASGLLSADGNFRAPLQDARGGTDHLAGSNNGYAFQVGMNAARSEFVTEAALLDGTSLPAPPLQGDATLTASYQLETFQMPATDATGLIGDRQSATGTFTLTADFAARTLSGGDGALAITGGFAPTGDISGTAAFDGMTGALAGDISGTEAVGIFNGQSVTGVFAGGFVAE